MANVFMTRLKEVIDSKDKLNASLSTEVLPDGNFKINVKGNLVDASILASATTGKVLEALMNQYPEKVTPSVAAFFLNDMHEMLVSAMYDALLERFGKEKARKLTAPFRR